MTPELEDYILQHIDPAPDNLNRLERDTNVQLLYPHMCSGHLQGRLLKMLTRMIAPQRILELGTYSGYSALAMAEGLANDDCYIDTIEIDDEQEDFINAHLAQSPVGHRVHLHIGDALEVLKTLTGPYDMAFIDANKRHYIQYYELVLPLIKPGGFILADNTLWAGKVAHQDEMRHVDAMTAGISAFNDALAADTRVEKVIVPLRDGLTLIYKKP